MTAGSDEALIFQYTEEQYGGFYKQHIVDIYKFYVEMADRISARRQSANSFYLAVNTTIVGASAFFSQDSISGRWLVAFAGIAIAIMWIRNIQSYKSLNAGKFTVINEIEKLLPISPYTAEWHILGRGTDKKRHVPFHNVEIIVPMIFIAIYAILCFVSVDWAWLCRISLGK